MNPLRVIRIWLCVGFAGLSLGGGTFSVQAVLIASGDGTGNTSMPANDPGWDNVGNRGVYLGNQWVLTANHLGAGAVTFQGVSYNAVPGSETQLENPSAEGDTEFTDLLMFRIDADPGLPEVTVGQNAPAAESRVTLIGDGRNRDPSLTLWEVDQEANPWEWTETNDPDAATHSGYQWANGATKRWGENEIEGTGKATVSGLTVHSLFTVFDDSGLPDEAHVAVGDSGGAVFYENASQWELAGLILARSEFSGQPDETAVFGNFAVHADLSVYHDQIAELVAVPEPAVFPGVLALTALVTTALWNRNNKKTL